MPFEIFLSCAVKMASPLPRRRRYPFEMQYHGLYLAANCWDYSISIRTKS
jgi:hypothetical protein